MLLQSCRSHEAQMLLQSPGSQRCPRRCHLTPFQKDSSRSYHLSPVQKGSSRTSKRDHLSRCQNHASENRQTQFDQSRTQKDFQGTPAGLETQNPESLGHAATQQGGHASVCVKGKAQTLLYPVLARATRQAAQTPSPFPSSSSRRPDLKGRDATQNCLHQS